MTTSKNRRDRRAELNAKQRKEFNRLVAAEVEEQVAAIRQQMEHNEQALEIAHRSAWATSILLAAGYATKELLMGELLEWEYGDIGWADTEAGVINGFDPEYADEAAQVMIKRAVQLLGTIDQYQLRTSDEIGDYLRDGTLPERTPVQPA